MLATPTHLGQRTARAWEAHWEPEAARLLGPEALLLAPEALLPEPEALLPERQAPLPGPEARGWAEARA